MGLSNGMGGWQLTTSVITTKGLRDIGWSLSAAQGLMTLRIPQQLQQLTDYRQQLLVTVHQRQQQLATVDFLIQWLQERNDD